MRAVLYACALLVPSAAAAQIAGGGASAVVPAAFEGDGQVTVLRGQVCGWSLTQDLQSDGAARRDALDEYPRVVLEPLDHIAATGLNDLGDMVGSLSPTPSVTSALRYVDDTATPVVLQTPFGPPVGPSVRRDGGGSGRGGGASPVSAEVIGFRARLRSAARSA